MINQVANFFINKELGYGANGNVYSIYNDINKVLKIGKVYDLFDGIYLYDKYLKIDEVLSYIQNNNPIILGKIFTHNYINMFERRYYNDEKRIYYNQAYITYYYVMEKLNKISNDEKKVFHSILSHEDLNKVKDYSINKIEQMLNGMLIGLDFDKIKILNFCKNLKNSDIIHNDIHYRNIMKNKDGDFKLIDLDSCQIRRKQ